MLDTLIKVLTQLFEGKEKDKDKKYSYGCIMLGFSIPKSKWEKIQGLIDDKDISTDDGMGREMDPHITILYGIHSDVPDEDVEVLIDKLTPCEVRFNHLSVFENPEFDVVKFTIRSRALEKMNEIFKKLPFTNNFPKYEPHATVAYVKSGTGKKYVQTLKDDLDFKLKPTKIIYSKADGTKKTYKFKDNGKKI